MERMDDVMEYREENAAKRTETVTRSEGNIEVKIYLRIFKAFTAIISESAFP